LASIVIRLGVSAGLAAAVGASGPLSVLGAMIIGVAAPLIVEKAARQIPQEYVDITSALGTAAAGAQPSQPTPSPQELVPPPQQPGQPNAASNAGAVDAP
jgi:hypothetical protein